MAARTTQSLRFNKKRLLAAAALGATALPGFVGMLNAPRMLAQTQPRLAFEVASVKENRSGDFRNTALQFLPSGRFVERGIPLMTVIAIAYDLPYYSDRLTSGPAWIRTSVYDIEATAEPSAIPAGTTAAVRREKMRMMLQTLLADRFKMVIRRETREGPVYAITVAKGGPKLQNASVEEGGCVDDPTGPQDYPKICHAFCCGQGQGIHAQAVDMSDLAAGISSFADRPVIDKTGIKGLFNIQTEGWAPMRPRPPRPPGQEPTAEDRSLEDPSTPTLFQIFGKLGLTLESQKAPVEIFVIDSAEKPSEN
jgi:uncharacterized protein (TIGR03435 family)